MAALDLAEQCLATNQISKDFLTKLVEKDFLTEDAVSEILDDTGLTKYLLNGKQKKRSPKKPKVSEEERSNAEYNPEKCPCRIWCPVGGFGLPNVQCSRNLPDGKSMCKMHSGKVDEGGNWWLGLVTEEPPAEPVFQPGKKKAHWWTEEAKDEADEKKKSSKKAAKKKVDSDEGEEEPKKKAKKKVKKVEKVDSDEEEEPKKKAKKKVKKVEKVDSDEEEEPKKKAKKKVKKKVEKVDSDEEEEEDKVEEKEEEDDDGNTPFIFEGVKYVRTEDGDIVNPDNYDLMGEDDGSGGIDWTDGEMEEKHQQLVAELE